MFYRALPKLLLGLLVVLLSSSFVFAATKTSLENARVAYLHGNKITIINGKGKKIHGWGTENKQTFYTAAALSPNHKYIAVEVDERESGHRGYGRSSVTTIQIMDMSGKLVSRLPAAIYAGHCMAWSEDGTLLAVDTLKKQRTSRVWALQVFDAAQAKFISDSTSTRSSTQPCLAKAWDQSSKTPTIEWDDIKQVFGDNVTRAEPIGKTTDNACSFYKVRKEGLNAWEKIYRICEDAKPVAIKTLWNAPYVE